MTTTMDDGLLALTAPSAKTSGSGTALAAVGVVLFGGAALATTQTHSFVYVFAGPYGISVFQTREQAKLYAQRQWHKPGLCQYSGEWMNPGNTDPWDEEVLDPNGKHFGNIVRAPVLSGYQAGTG